MSYFLKLCQILCSHELTSSLTPQSSIASASRAWRQPLASKMLKPGAGRQALGLKGFDGWRAWGLALRSCSCPGSSRPRLNHNYTTTKTTA